MLPSLEALLLLLPRKRNDAVVESLSISTLSHAVIVVAVLETGHSNRDSKEEVVSTTTTMMSDG